MISVIVPTFDNLEFLDECLNSILLSSESFDTEILVGVDSCLKTRKYIELNKFNPKIKFFFFKENVGPYVVKNTLSLNSKGSILLFFDSDDLMQAEMISSILHCSKSNDYVRFKYCEFNNLDSVNNQAIIGEGVFAIKKSTFLSFNGFYPWRCAADSEFRNRNSNYFTYPTPLFLRRIHSKSLTQQKETAYNSELRLTYAALIKSQMKMPPKKLVISDFELII